MANKDGKQNILSLNTEELKAVMLEYGEAAFRAKQIFGWLAKGTESFEDMLNIPSKLIARLEEDYYIGLPCIVRSSKSAIDGTVKVLYEMADGSCVESVCMQYSYVNSICISTQAGCRMGCTFCATGIGGLERNLTAGEMLGEVLQMRNFIGDRINHIVLMGMGEPFDNYENVARFLKLVNDKAGYNLSMRDITVSTCGIIPMIERFGDDFKQVNLAVSLHAPNDEIRRRTMPVAKAYPYKDLMKACKEYTQKTGRRITFEYSMINGVNDSAECAEELASNIKGWLSHVNLIPLNAVKEKDYKASETKRIKAFKSILESYDIACTIRRTLGSDIDAACGQLRNNNRNN